jgi:GTP:adenosylcobinamide-phosphate guanylyltransferase
LVMAADRNPDDPVARAAGVRCKALAPVGGTPMVFRVLGALKQSSEVGSRLLCGPPRAILDSEETLRAGVDSGAYSWTENKDSPSASVAAALGIVEHTQPVLLTTSDHALLNDRIVDHFCRQARDSEYDLLVALAPHHLITTAFPSVRRTVLRFSDQACCSCNLFAFMTPASRSVAGFWTKVESQRKKPWRVMSILGWWFVIRYLLGRLSLEQALSRITRILGMKIGAVIMPFPEAAVDVDTEKDLRFVRQLLEGKNTSDSTIA